MLFHVIRNEWKITLFTLVMLPLLIKLGYWQLDRHQLKLSINDQMQQAQDKNSFIGQSHIPADLMYYQQIAVCGHFISPYHFLLDNRTHQGTAGYYVLSLFKTCANETLLINRGWIARINGTTQHPKIPHVPDTQHMLSGRWMPFYANAWLLKTEQSSHHQEVFVWPRIIQDASLTALSNTLKAIETELLPIKGFIYLAEQQIGSTSVAVQYTVKNKAQKHLGYAVQWFSMACVLLGLYIYLICRSWQSLNHSSVASN